MLVNTISKQLRIVQPKKQKTVSTNLFGEPEKKKYNASIGNKFETEVLNTCKEYLRLELAYIQKNATPTQWIPPNAKSGKAGFLMHVKKTGFDFVGCYKLNLSFPYFTLGDYTYKYIWQPIFIEVKTTKENHIDCYQEKTGIKEHQIMELQWMENHGIEAYILWQLRESGIIFKIKPSQLVEMTQNKKHLSLVDCSEKRIPRVATVRSGGGMFLDFLNLLDN